MIIFLIINFKKIFIIKIMLFSFAPKTKSRTKENIKNKNNNKCINIIKETIKNEANDYCFECNEKHPQYISINNSIFLCRECILNHLQLSQEASTIIKNDLKILTLNEIQYIYNGGNQKLLDFINNEFPKLKGLEPQIFFNTMAMDYYRKRLKFLTEGGDEPIKPTIENAYTLKEKIEETEMTDTDLNYNDVNQDIKKDNVNENTIKKDDDYSIANITNKNRKNIKRINNIKNINTDHKSNSQSNEHFVTNSTRKTLKTNKEEENIHSDDKNTYKNHNIQSNILSKNIKFKKNYNNFDNENYNYNTNKDSEGINIYSSIKEFNNNKPKENLYMKSVFFSPQPTGTNLKNVTPDKNKIINNVYSKPKQIPIPFINKLKYKTKHDVNEVNTNNKINIVFNINEFNIDKDKTNLRENIKRLDHKTGKNYNEKIQNIKINNYYNFDKSKNDETFENTKINKTSISIINRSQSKKIIEQQLNKINSTKNINYYKDRFSDLSNEKNGKTEKKSTQVSVNIAHLKIIKNINNYNINIDNDKKKIEDYNENISAKTHYNFHKKNNKNNNIIIQRLTLKTKRENINSENNTIKNDISTDNKRRIAKRLIDYKNNKYNTKNETESKENYKNALKNYLNFTMNKSASRDINNFKCNQKLIKKNNDSYEDNYFSFYNSNEKNKNKEKDNKTIEKIKTKNDLISNINNKTMDEPNKKYTIKESIRNKYKNKKNK